MQGYPANPCVEKTRSHNGLLHAGCSKDLTKTNWILGDQDTNTYSTTQSDSFGGCDSKAIELEQLSN